MGAFMGGLMWAAALAFSPASGATAAVTTASEAAVDAFHSALAKGDTKAAAALLTDDALIFEEGGAEHSKAEYAAHHLPADAEFARSIRMSPARRFGDQANGMAWIATEGRMTGMYKGKHVDRITTESMVLRETAAGWKIVHIHWSSAAAPTQPHTH